MPDEKTPTDPVEPEGEHNAATETGAEPDTGAVTEAAEADAGDTTQSPASAEDGSEAAPRRRRGALLLVVAVAIIAVAAAAWWLTQRDRATGADVAPTAAARATEPEPVARQAEPPAAAAPAETIIPPATRADIDALRDEIRRLETELGSSRDALDALSRTVREQERENARLAASIDERVNLLDSLPGRVLNLEQGVETLQGISAGSRDAWLLAEAEYYMQIANAQVQLANNPALAARALQLADERVRELANPAYTPVRREIAGELALLAATEDVDVEGITLRLGSLAAMVPTLPLENDVVVPEAGATGSDVDELTGWARARAATREALSGMVRVRRSDERVQAMLSPEAEYFLRLNLQLQLQAARLSLLLGDAAGFRQSLEDASGWLGRYFEAEDPAVGNAIAELEQTAATTIVTERPDVSGSLTLLRRQRTLERAGE